MAGNRFISPVYTAMGTNGALPFATLEFYDNANPTTPMNTYADVDLVTPNPFPMVADLNGNFINDIFLELSSYREVLKDQNGVVVWDKSDCNTFNTPAAGGFPYRGAVIDFYGDQSELDVFLANDWFVMDGSSSTPNLNDLYIKTCIDVASIGGTGGTNNDITVGASVDGHALTIAEMPAHTHNFFNNENSYAIAGNGAIGNIAQGTPTTSTGGGDAHTHGLTVTPTNFQPSYYTLIKLVYLP